MSIALMTEAWRIKGISSTQKLVLLSLADNANDRGECFPSIAQIVDRTCLSERAVRIAIRSLEAEGFVRSESRKGTSTVYFIAIQDADKSNAPRHDVPPCAAANEGSTPAPDAPAPDAGGHRMPPTPAPDAPHPRHDVPPTPARGAPKPSLNRQLNRQGTVNRPEGVPDEVWTDFLAIRKAKRSPLTATALQGIDREARRAGMTVGQALAMCCERGWQGFRADWVDGGRQGSSTSGPAAQPSRHAGFSERSYVGTDPATIDWAN